MTGQELYDFLGALSEEERKREVRIYDREWVILRPFNKAKLQDSALRAWVEITADDLDWYDPSEFEDFEPCIVLMDKGDFYDVPQ